MGFVFGGSEFEPPSFDSFVAMLTGCSHVILGIIAEELGVRFDDMQKALDTEPVSISPPTRATTSRR